MVDFWVKNFEISKDISNNDNWIFTIWRLHNAVNMKLKANNAADKYRIVSDHFRP